MGHVAVQHHRVARDAVHRGMDEHRRRLDPVAPGQYLPVGVDEHDVVGADLAPEQSARVDQEALRAVGQGNAEVVAHAFAQAMVGGGAQRQRQVFAQRCGARVVACHGRSPAAAVAAKSLAATGCGIIGRMPRASNRP